MPVSRSVLRMLVSRSPLPSRSASCQWPGQCSNTTIQYSSVGHERTGNDGSSYTSECHKMRGLFQESPIQDKRREELFDVRQRGACAEAAVPLRHGARRKAPWMWVRGYVIVLFVPRTPSVRQETFTRPYTS